MFNSIIFLSHHDDTPSNYRDNPGEVPGPFASLQECLDQSGTPDFKVGKTWERDGSLWVAPAQAEGEEG